MTMRASSHKKWPWSTWHIPERNLVSKSISFVLYQRWVTIENMSNPGNNKQLWNSWHEIKEKIDFKIKKPMVCIKGYHSKWPCLPLATISDLEALDTFQRDIWFQNLNPLFYIKSNEWLFKWVFYLIGNFKAKQIPDSMQMILTSQIWILLSEIDLKHFILSVLMKHRMKT